MIFIFSYPIEIFAFLKRRNIAKRERRRERKEVYEFERFEEQEAEIEYQRVDKVHDLFEVDIDRRYAIIKKGIDFHLVFQRRGNGILGGGWRIHKDLFSSSNYSDVTHYARREGYRKGEKR